MFDNEKNIIAVDTLSDKVGRVKITLSNNVELTGVSWGITPYFDDEGEETPFNCVTFRAEGHDNIFQLREDEIKKVEQI